MSIGVKGKQLSGGMMRVFEKTNKHRTQTLGISVMYGKSKNSNWFEARIYVQ